VELDVTSHRFAVFAHQGAARRKVLLRWSKSRHVCVWHLLRRVLVFPSTLTLCMRLWRPHQFPFYLCRRTVVRDTIHPQGLAAAHSAPPGDSAQVTPRAPPCVSLWLTHHVCISMIVLFCSRSSQSGLSADCPNVCPTGSYCPEGSAAPLNCPAGYFGSTTGLSSSACSGQCPAGYFCPEHTVTPNTCAAGRYCPLGATSATLCPGGYYGGTANAGSTAQCGKVVVVVWLLVFHSVVSPPPPFVLR
jgi:hypothetical protein